MEKKEIIKILNNQYPEIIADTDDFVGMQLDGKNEINKILVTLDITIDTISQAIMNNVDMIISHHPLFFGEKEKLLLENKMLKSQYDLLKEHGINVYIIHTNADFAPSSIAFNQALSLNCNEIEQTNENKSVIASIDEIQLGQLVERIRQTYNYNYSFRTNANLTDYISNLHIASGASGDLISYDINVDKLFIVGEMKHHHWVIANNLGYKVLEIGHFSESIFKEMIEVLLMEKVEIVKSKEENGYIHV